MAETESGTVSIQPCEGSRWRGRRGCGRSMPLQAIGVGVMSVAADNRTEGWNGKWVAKRLAKPATICMVSLSESDSLKKILGTW